LTKQNKQQHAIILSLITQRDEATDKLSDYEHKTQERDKEMERLTAENQTLQKSNEDLVQLNKQQTHDMSNLIKQRDAAQMSSDEIIASLRATIANYESKEQQQKKHDDKTLNDQFDFTQDHQEGPGHSTRWLIHHAGPIKIVVSGAGMPEVNGVYMYHVSSEQQQEILVHYNRTRWM
jgi:dsDNA-specific endonuclease/ATPase MutS2